ncbi:hypothetical protein C1701_13860 [Actinoalloteichus sp. AHMU CJ021]|nr:hypothetical protein C1701_13860 [Actinoalloteichus sp. AHMU CJ021]
MVIACRTQPSAVPNRRAGCRRSGNGPPPGARPPARPAVSLGGPPSSRSRAVRTSSRAARSGAAGTTGT